MHQVTWLVVDFRWRSVLFLSEQPLRLRQQAFCSAVTCVLLYSVPTLTLKLTLPHIIMSDRVTGSTKVEISPDFWIVVYFSLHFAVQEIVENAWPIFQRNSRVGWNAPSNRRTIHSIYGYTLYNELLLVLLPYWTLLIQFRKDDRLNITDEVFGLSVLLSTNAWKVDETRR